MERNTGEYEHSRLQVALAGWIGNRQRGWNVRRLIAQRIGAAPGRYRVPDICIVSRDQEIEQVFTRPPLVCIEVLAREDSFRGMKERVEVPSSPIRIPLEDLFADLD